MTKKSVETKRGEIVAAMCDRILAQANQEKFEAKTAKDFLELFEDPPRIRRDEKGNPLPLKSVDFYRFQENDLVLDKLQDIAAVLARMEDSNDRMKEHFDSLKQRSTDLTERCSLLEEVQGHRGSRSWHSGSGEVSGRSGYRNP